MMPDGLEEGLSLQDMADLLEFIAGTACSGSLSTGHYQGALTT